MAKDWSVIALDERLFFPDRSPVPAGSATPRWDSLRHLDLAARSLLVGVLITLLYVWPVTMLLSILTGRISSVMFATVLAAGIALTASACWLITQLEARRWARDWHKVSEYAEPSYWR
jgi:hypothetical protein